LERPEDQAVVAETIAAQSIPRSAACHDSSIFLDISRARLIVNSSVTALHKAKAPPIAERGLADF
jgi:hypothetical protein